jgi:hypothetical protein
LVISIKFKDSLSQTNANLIEYQSDYETYQCAEEEEDNQDDNQEGNKDDNQDAMNLKIISKIVDFLQTNMTNYEKHDITNIRKLDELIILLRTNVKYPIMKKNLKISSKN